MNANELPIWGTQLKENVPDATVALIPSPVGPDGKGDMLITIRSRAPSSSMRRRRIKPRIS